MYAPQFRYWCHGYTFDGIANQWSSPFSGLAARAILADEWHKICCALATPGEDIVAFAGGPVPPPNHSGKIIAVTSINGKLDEMATYDEAKRGVDPLGVYTFLEEVAEYGRYRCYTQKPEGRKDMCCELGDHELPLDSLLRP